MTGSVFTSGSLKPSRLTRDVVSILGQTDALSLLRSIKLSSRSPNKGKLKPCDIVNPHVVRIDRGILGKDLYWKVPPPPPNEF